MLNVDLIECWSYCRVHIHHGLVQLNRVKSRFTKCCCTNVVSSKAFLTFSTIRVLWKFLDGWIDLSWFWNYAMRRNKWDIILLIRYASLHCSMVLISRASHGNRDKVIQCRFKTWISHYNHKQWDAITHQSWNSMMLKLEHECVITFHTKNGGCDYLSMSLSQLTLITSFMEPIWGPSGADRTQVGPMLVPWTLLSGNL